MSYVAELFRLRHGEFLSVNFLTRRKVVPYQRPHDRRRYAFVIVARHVADAGNLLPRDIGEPSLEFGGKLSARLGDDFDIPPPHEPALTPVGHEDGECDILEFGPNRLNRHENIVEPREV